MSYYPYVRFIVLINADINDFSGDRSKIRDGYAFADYFNKRKNKNASET